MPAKVKTNVKPIERLRKSLVTRHLRKAVTAATQPVLQDARAAARSAKRFGFLAKSLSKKVRVYKGVVVAIVGARTDRRFAFGHFVRGKHRGAERIARPSKYLHFLESGVRGHAPRPVITTAYRTAKNSYPSKVSSEFWRSIKAELPKR